MITQETNETKPVSWEKLKWTNFKMTNPQSDRDLQSDLMLKFFEF